ncbi:hypothetical protein HJG60_008189 [Phyllostomus discolor]|uniref:Uncharacterized protein n=1 Tax=Phyllostomus discolor TaxID=89673 RepID=A0A834DSI0_9CHIR|nr:hypothetical protein HJG60_008189 [Phyllostomus discolor]
MLRGSLGLPGSRAWVKKDTSGKAGSRPVRRLEAISCGKRRHSRLTSTFASDAVLQSAQRLLAPGSLSPPRLSLSSHLTARWAEAYRHFRHAQRTCAESTATFSLERLRGCRLAAWARRREDAQAALLLLSRHLGLGRGS